MTTTHRGAYALSLACVLLTACSDSCGRGEERAGGGPTPVARATTPPPEGLLLEAGVDDLGALLSAIRGQMSEETARFLLPPGAHDVVERFAILPESVKPHVPESARLRFALLRDGDASQRVLAVRVTRNADVERPLGPETALIEGAPHGAKWVRAAPAEGSPAIALLDDLLFVGDGVAALERAIPYVRDVAMPTDVGAGLRFRVADGVLGGQLRADLEQMITMQSTAAAASARTERGRHDDAPALGEPEQAITMARDNARRLLAYLPDAGEVLGRLAVEPHGIDLDIGVAVKPATPLARALGELGAGAPYGFASLPTTVALARATYHASDDPLVESIVRVAGNRVSDADRRKLEAAESTLRASTGPAHVLAFGGSPEGAYVLYGAATRDAVLELGALRDAITVPFIGVSLGGVLGCESFAPGALRMGGSTSLCRRREPPYPSLELAQGSGRVALALTTVERAGATHTAVSSFASGTERGGPGTLGGSPDVARALGALGDQVITAFVFIPTNLIPALGLFDVPLLRRLAAAPRGDETLAPTFAALTRSSEGAHLRLIVAPHGADQLFQLGFLAMQMVMAP